MPIIISAKLAAPAAWSRRSNSRDVMPARNHLTSGGEVRVRSLKRTRKPSPLAGEGGRSECNEDRPGEGLFDPHSSNTPHPARTSQTLGARHPLPQGERESASAARPEG